MFNFEEIPTFSPSKAIERKEQEDKEFDLFIEAYSKSELARKLDMQTKENGKTGALFTDVDDTFFKAGKEKATGELTKKSKEKNFPIIAVTGNDFQGLLKRIESGELPSFDTIIGSVGTEIWYLQQNKSGKIEYKKDGYFEALLKKMGFERYALVKKAAEFISQMKERMPGTNLDFQNPGTERKFLAGEEADIQSYKISFYFYSNQQLLDKITRDISDNFPEQSVVISEEINYNGQLSPDEKNKKYNLDILPLTKGDAVNYLSKITGIGQGIVAGDSGNDTKMLLDAENLNAVLVGGYKQEVLSAVKASIPSSEWKSGKRSFQKIIQPDGSTKAIYIEPEPGKRQASESILRAAEILSRARNVQEIRKKRALDDSQ